MFKQKYLKYKLKYLNLKKQLNQQGYGNQTESINSNSANSETVDSEKIDPIELSKKIIIYDYDTKKQLYEINKYDEEKLPHTFNSLIYFILTELKKDPNNIDIGIDHINLYKTITSGKQTYCDKGIYGKISMDLPDSSVSKSTPDKYCLQIKKPISVEEQIPKRIKTGIKMSLANGDILDFKIDGNGIWKDNEYTGYGKMTYKIIINNIPHNISYDGKIVNSYENGYGVRKKLYPDTNKFLVEKGIFINGRLMRGKIIFSNNTIYETTTIRDNNGIEIGSGYFENLKIIGFGKITYFNGEIHQGVFNGEILFGTITTSKKTIIRSTNGFFKNSYLNNYGIITYADGTVYEGCFKDNELHGKGKRSDPDGHSEEGIFKDGILIKGKKISPNNFIAEGKFKNERLNGKGKICFAEDNLCKEGMFKEGYLHGQGKISKPHVFIEEGNFNMGKLNGKGKYIDLKTNTEHEGIFQNGLLHGKGKIIMKSSDGNVIFRIMEGNFYKGKLDGEIQITESNGEKNTNTYKRGQLILKTIQPIINNNFSLNNKSYDDHLPSLSSITTPIKEKKQNTLNTPNKSTTPNISTPNLSTSTKLNTQNVPNSPIKKKN